MPSFSLAAELQLFFWVLMVVRWIYLQMELFVYELLNLHHYLVEFVVLFVMGQHAVGDIGQFPFWVAVPSLVVLFAMHLTWSNRAKYGEKKQKRNECENNCVGIRIEHINTYSSIGRPRRHHMLIADNYSRWNRFGLCCWCIWSHIYKLNTGHHWIPYYILICLKNHTEISHWFKCI